MNVKEMRRIWKAMHKLCNDEPLTKREWEDIGWLGLVDRNNLEFGPDNVKWATTEAEHEDNIKFYKSLGPAIH